MRHDIRTETDVPPLANQVDIVLLDIRQHQHEALTLLRGIKQTLRDAEVIVINRAGNIRSSMEAMQAGADDEIIAPCDTRSLKKKVMAACRRQEKRRRKREKRSFLGIFSDSMAAATFAQAGEFDTAVDLMNDLQKKRQAKDQLNPKTKRTGS